MNLLDRIKSSLVILSGLIFFGCTEDSGLTFDTQESLALEYLEFELDHSNVIIDSLRTDFTFTTLAGEYKHEELGQVRAESYLQFQYDSGVVISDTLLYDGVTFQLKIGEFLKNTSEDEVSFLVQPLDQEIFGSVVYLSDFGAEKVDNPVDNISIRVREENRLSFTRPDAIGNYFYEQLIEEDSLTLNYLGRFSLSPAGDIGAVISIEPLSDSSSVTINTVGAESGISYATRFTFNQYYSGIERNRDIQGSSPENLEEFDLPNGSVINHLFGVYTVVDLSPYKDFVEGIGDIVVNRAELVTPVSETDKPHAGIRYYFYNDQTGIYGEGRYIEPTTTVILTNESYVTNTLQFLTAGIEDLSYVADVTLFSDIYARTFTSTDEFITDRLVLLGNDIVTLDETKVSDVLTLRVYYTQPTN